MKTLIEATKFENPTKAGEEYINSFGRKGFTYVVYGSKGFL